MTDLVAQLVGALEAMLDEDDGGRAAEQARAAISAAKDGGWLPIETAPKDCAFLGYQRLSDSLWLVAPMYWAGSAFLLLQFHSDNTEHEVQPTHWQPLPNPPKGEV